MFGLSFPRPTPTAVPSASPPTQPQARNTRSPLAQAAHKLKKALSRPRPTNAVSLTRPDETNHGLSSRYQPQTNLPSNATFTQGNAGPNSNSTLPTPPSLTKQDIQKRARARFETYLKLTGDFRRSGTAELLTRQETHARDVTRASAYFTLIGVTAEKSKNGEMAAKRLARAEFRRWGAAEQVAEREIEERELDRLDAYQKLTGEI
ncbi:hypothetical protein FRC00_003154 [Tulasnella sp. 408]|nr:hypothetical protein FRC00_003154 [Tulasnella sp. 408]